MLAHKMTSANRRRAWRLVQKIIVSVASGLAVRIIMHVAENQNWLSIWF